MGRVLPYSPIMLSLLLALLPMPSSATSAPAPAILPFAVSARPPHGCLFFTSDEAAKRGGRRPVLMTLGEPMPATASMNLRGRVETLRRTSLGVSARPAVVGASWSALYVTDDRALALHLNSRVVALGAEPGATAEAAMLTLVAEGRTIERLQVTGFCF